MRIRGAEYLEWASQGGINTEYDEILPGGAQLNVEVRMKPHGVCAIFVSLYTRSGRALYEELFATLHGSPEEGLTWGVTRGLSEHRVHHSNVPARKIPPSHEV
ncbi:MULTISPECIES: hypothetical protein [unclassified Pseudomonas]|uniref:hypothetical protein n=1 Tax=unclassified Pseudomonas TaxID=196821 RepID=UPI0025FBF8DD|nr:MULTISPECIES: hypothetical protein [unclassified Pseudomonas]